MAGASGSGRESRLVRQQGMVTPDPHLVTSLELEAEAADDDASWWPLISSCCLHQMVDNTQNRVFSFCKIVHVMCAYSLKLIRRFISLS